MEHVSSFLKQRPVLCAVRNMDRLERALSSPAIAIMLLTGKISTVQGAVEKAMDRDKLLFVHTELIEGLKQDREGIVYLARHLRVDGIITTRSHAIKIAQEEGLLTIQRLFLLDSAALKTGLAVVQRSKPHALELLPGPAAELLAPVISKEVTCPLIAGGLIQTKSMVQHLLEQGVMAVSTSCEHLWNYPD